MQLREAAKQVKVLDLDFGGCLTDRKQLMDQAREALREKVRADLRADFDVKTARASLQVIAKASTKREYPGGDMCPALRPRQGHQVGCRGHLA